MSDFKIDGSVLTQYTGSGGAVEIPEGVTKIDRAAFYDRRGDRGRNMTSVTIPKGVMEISNAAFYLCDNLASVTLPEGLAKIEYHAFCGCSSLKEIVIPDSVWTIGQEAFSKCKALASVTLPAGLRQLESNVFDGCANLKSVRIPDGVVSIDYGAFSGCKKLGRVELPASVREINTLAFMRCPRLVLIAPHLLPKDVDVNYLRPLLALGFCVAPDRYSGETAEAYARYVKGKKKDILEAAEKLWKEDKQAVKDYFGVKPVPRGTRSANPYDKLSPQKKVRLLEETVLSGDMAKLEEVLTGCKEFEFTARALGLAGRCGSLEMVQRLVESGADFCNPRDPSLSAKYDLYDSYSGFWGSKTVYHYFEYLLTEDGLGNSGRIGDLRNIRDLLESDGKERPPIAEPLRADILRWLAGTKQARCDCSKLLWATILEDKPVLMDGLLDGGAELKFYDLSDYPDDKLPAVVSRLLDISQRQKKKMPVSLALLKRLLEDAKLIARLLDEGALPEKLDTTGLLKASLDAQNAGTLALCLERGYLKSNATRDKLIQKSIDEGKTEHTAVLLEYKNKTADFAKERAAEEAKMMKDLTAAPDSVYMLKQLWKYKKRTDGTLCITGYKGTEKEVVVPGKIGKAMVTAIDDCAFSTVGARLTSEQIQARKNLESVTIPEGIVEMGDGVFQSCESLKFVSLPDSLKKMGSEVFKDCPRLEEVRLPKKMRSIPYGTFCYCPKLRKVELPKNLKNIDSDAFFGCAALTEIALPKGLREIGPNAFQGSGLETIAIPGSVKSVSYNSFAVCRHLREVVVEEGVETLWRESFTACESLTRVVLPKSVDIHQGAFNSCLQTMHICAPVGSHAEYYAKVNFHEFEPIE